jgi:hypothetical protein
LEEQISDRMKSTRQQLLEHFDEEFHEKLKVHMEESKGYLNKYGSLLWVQTEDYIIFVGVPDKLQFLDEEMDKLIEDTEARLKQKIERKELFSLKWKLV